MPDRSWKMNRYCMCKVCRDLNIDFYVEDSEYKPGICKNCGAKLDTVNAGVFLIPEFGFEADGDKIKRPGLKKPIRTFRSDVAYNGANKSDLEELLVIGKAEVKVRAGKNEEMVILNRSNFYVCDSCGYTELDEKRFSRLMKKEHRRSNGRQCQNKQLKQFSLAYKFHTDILTLRFETPEISNEDIALSVLYGMLEGASKCLSVDRDDISGCLKWFYNKKTGIGNYGLILYDKTPGGAGHVRRMQDPTVLNSVMQETLKLMKNCTCGGESRDTSCYSCLRNYYNQKFHDRLQRGYVIDFLEHIYT